MYRLIIYFISQNRASAWMKWGKKEESAWSLNFIILHSWYKQLIRDSRDILEIPIHQCLLKPMVFLITTWPLAGRRGSVECDAGKLTFHSFPLSSRDTEITNFPAY